MNKFSHLIKRCDHMIFASSIGLSIFGVLSLTAITHDKSPFLSREVIIQSVALIIGIIVAGMILMLGYRYFTDLEKAIYILSILLLLIVYIPGLGVSVNGSRSWIDLGVSVFSHLK